MSNIKHEATRPDALMSRTLRFTLPHYLPAIESLSPLQKTKLRPPITIHFTVTEDAAGTPFEIFFHDVDDALLQELLFPIGILASRVLRLGGTLADLATDFEDIITPLAHYDGPRLFKSLMARVGHEIRQYHAKREGQMTLTLKDAAVGGHNVTT